MEAMKDRDLEKLLFFLLAWIRLSLAVGTLDRLQQQTSTPAPERFSPRQVPSCGLMNWFCNPAIFILC